MNETEFNLLDEPWIRVMDDNCQIKEVSLCCSPRKIRKTQKCGITRN